MNQVSQPRSKLFHLHEGQFVPIAPVDIAYEDNLHSMISEQLTPLFDITFLANEFLIGDQRRIDTIGIDQHGSPVVIEYKVGQDSGVINQALFYTAWINSNRPVFEALVSQRIHPSPKINWTGLRAICIAKSFSSYDVLALEQMNTNIDLMTYQMHDLGVLSLSVVGTRRKPDYRHELLPDTPKRRLTLPERLETLPSVARRSLEQLMSEAKGISTDLILTETDREWFIYGGSELGRIYITESKFPSVRIEIYDEDVDWECPIRHKKTKRGVDFIVCDQKTLSQAINSLARVYTKAYFS